MNNVRGFSGSQTLLWAGCSPMLVLISRGPAVGGLESTLTITCGGTPVTSIAPVAEPEGPTVSIIGDMDNSVREAGGETMPE